MSITDDIRSAIASKLTICYDAEKNDLPVNTSCVICNNDFTINNKLCIHAKNEGPVCLSCAERFAPEMLKTILEFKDKNIHHLTVNHTPVLSKEEWVDVEQNIEALLSLSDDLSKGVARGIVEAPAGHIGLLYLAKDIIKPERKADETDKDYDLRVKSFRIQKLQERIKAETSGRINVLRYYFNKMGLPNSTLLE